MNDLEESLKLFEIINDQTGIAYVTGELGIVYYYQNQFAQAIANYRRTINSCESRRDMHGAMIGHFNVGDILLQDEQFELAAKELQRAWELAGKRKLLNVESMAGLYLAEALIALSRFDQAEAVLNALQPLIARQSSHCFSGQEVALRATLHWKQTRSSEVEKEFARAFLLLENDGCQYEYAHACLAYADCLKEMGEFGKAKIVLSEAKKTFNDLDNALGLQAIEKALKNIQ